MIGREFGYVYLMHSMACSGGLMDALGDVYGEDLGRTLAALGITNSANLLRHRYIPVELERNAARKVCGAPSCIDWKDPGALREWLMDAETRSHDLFARLDPGRMTVVMELTALGGGLDRVSCIDGFRETVVGGSTVFLGVDGVGGLPFYYRFAEDGGHGMASLREVSSELRSMGPRNIHFALLRIRSMDDMAYAVDRGLTFTTRISTEFRERQDLDAAVAGTPPGPRGVVGDHTFTCRETVVRAGEGSFRLLSVEDEDVAVRQMRP